MAKVVYVDKVNDTKIFAERAEYTRAGRNIDGSLDSKIDKLAGATSGNLAAFDSSGSLVDSNQSAANLVHDASYVHTDNNYTTNEKNKLEGIESGAEVNDIDTIKVNGTAQTVTSKTVDITVPTGGTSNPSMDGTASAGSATTYSKSDHVHPSDTSREAVANKDSSIPTTPVSGHYPSTEAVANFVNSSIATNTANFLGTYDVVSDLGLTTSATNAQIASALNSYTFPAGTTVTNNDYVFISINYSTTTDIDEFRRFKYSAGTPNGSWAYEYTLNNSSYTQSQWDAINSGATATKIGNYDSHLSNTNNPHSVTAAQVGLGNVGNFKAVSTVAGQGLNSTEQSNARTNIGAGTSNLTLGSTSSTAAAGNHTHTLNIEEVASGATWHMSANTAYKLTAGGNSIIIKTPVDTNTDTKVTAVGNHYAPAEDSTAKLSADASSSTSATWGSTALVTGVDIKRDAKGHVVGVAVDSIRMPANPDTNTHRPIQMNGSEILGNNATALNLKAGSNVSLSNSSGTVTINATDSTYPLAIKSITRSGTTFTATRYDGTTFTFTQQDNNTTYSAGTGISLSGTTFSNSGVRSLTVSDVSRLTINTGGTTSSYYPLAVTRGRFVITHSNTYTYSVTGSIFSLTTASMPDGSSMDYSSFWSHIARPTTQHSVIVVANDSNTGDRIMKMCILSLMSTQGQFATFTVVNSRPGNEKVEFCWDNDQTTTFTLYTYTGTVSSVKLNDWTVGAGKSRTFFVTRLVGSTAFSITATS